MTKGESPKGHHLIITRRASIRIITIITILTILISRSLWRRRGRSGETTKASPSSCNMIDMGVHLTQLITESVKASIHALNLCHDSLEGHITSRGRRRRRGRNSWSYKTHRLHTWLLRSKLGLAPSNRIGVDGTHSGEVRRIRNKDRKVVKDPRNSWRKDELITSRRILINIKDKSDEVRGEVYRKIFKEGQKKSSTRLCDRVIVRQCSKNKWHHHV